MTKHSRVGHMRYGTGKISHLIPGLRHRKNQSLKRLRSAGMKVHSGVSTGP